MFLRIGRISFENSFFLKSGFCSWLHIEILVQAISCLTQRPIYPWLNSAGCSLLQRMILLLTAVLIQRVCKLSSKMLLYLLCLGFRAMAYLQKHFFLSFFFFLFTCWNWLCEWNSGYCDCRTMCCHFFSRRYYMVVECCVSLITLTKKKNNWNRKTRFITVCIRMLVKLGTFLR